MLNSVKTEANFKVYKTYCPLFVPPSCFVSSVSLLTALRIWVSLPDELTQSEADRCPLPPQHRHPVTPTRGGGATCNLSQCNCDLERVSSGRMVQVYHHNTGHTDTEVSILSIMLMIYVILNAFMLSGPWNQRNQTTCVKLRSKSSSIIHWLPTVVRCTFFTRELQLYIISLSF